MRALDRLRNRFDGDDQGTPSGELTKLTKGASVSFVSPPEPASEVFHASRVARREDGNNYTTTCRLDNLLHSKETASGENSGMPIWGTDKTDKRVPIKGECHKCGQPVTWLGPLEGLRNWLGEVVHLRCPAPQPEFAAPPEPQPDPDRFDEAGYSAMRRDLITVIKDLAADGKKVGQIARMFGLQPHEVWGVLRGEHG